MRPGYPVRLSLVCPLCFWQRGARSGAPAVVAALRGGWNMPLCEEHLGTALAVELSVKGLTPAGEALHALLEAYGVGELSSLDAVAAGPSL